MQVCGIIELILLGHESKILSVICFKGKFFSTDEAGILKCWINQNDVISVKINEPLKLYIFGEHLLGISETRTYLIDYIYMQIVPIKETSVTVDYPCIYHITHDNIQEIKLEFPLET